MAPDSTESPLPDPGAPADEALLQDLLVKTSRTFALAIPLLPEPTRREVTVAYLLFRIADTFEDASVHWQRSAQIGALGDFANLLRRPSLAQAESLTRSWLSEPPTEHRGYRELLERTPAVIRAFLELSVPAQEIVARHTVRTAEGMASVVERADQDGVLRLRSVPDLQGYCYIVAGIVGEMLTDLFVLERSELAPVADYLRERSASFGEGLQLVNILKDSASDAREGRNYVPEGIGRAEIFELARRNLETASDYILALQRAGGPHGIVLFTALPVELAWATLQRVERDGPGAKLTRPEVFALDRRVRRAVAEGRPAVRVPESLSNKNRARASE